MINHLTIHVNDIDASKKFYSEALKPLGYAVTSEHPEWKLIGMGVEGNADLWIYAGEGARQQAHVAFTAENKEQVQAFYDGALVSGGKDNGAPGYRKNYTPGYYSAFALDPSGNNIEAVFKDPNPPAE